MRLQNSYTFQNFKVPKFFDGKISISCDGELSEDEIQSFNTALYLFSKLIDSSSHKPILLSLNINFCCHKSPIFIVEYPDDGLVMGSFHQIIVYPVWKWRKYNLPGWVILLPLIEELCHAIYLIPDGPPIEQKVTEVLQILGHDVTYSTYLKEIEKYVDNASNDPY